MHARKIDSMISTIQTKLKQNRLQILWALDTSVLYIMHAKNLSWDIDSVEITRLF